MALTPVGEAAEACARVDTVERQLVTIVVGARVAVVPFADGRDIPALS